MSTKRKATKRVKPASTEPKALPPLPPTVTVDREWLRERLEWLDVDAYALKAIRGLHDLVNSHGEAFREQQRVGSCSERAASMYVTWGLEWQQEIVEQLDLLLQSVEHVRNDLSEMANPRPAVTP